MSRQTKKDIQTNILYDYYRFCNEQEDCCYCPLNYIIDIHNEYPEDEDFYYDLIIEEQERRDRLYYGIDSPIIETEETTEKEFEEKTETENWMFNDGFDMSLEGLKEEKYKCLRNFSKYELELAVEEINEWCKENPECYLKDRYVPDYKKLENSTYPNKCPYDYSILKENGCMTEQMKKDETYLPNEVMHPVICRRKRKGYNKDCTSCKHCWDTPMRYEDET